MNNTYPELYMNFFKLYHSGEYWEAHETLEDLWQPQRHNKFYHGLIQIAAIMHQLERGKVKGARKLCTSALKYLCAYPDMKDGVFLPDVIGWIDNCLKCLPDHLDSLSRDKVLCLSVGKCPLPKLHISSNEQ